MASPFRPDPPITLGLVGGVASGKSTVADLFAAHGLTCLNADEIAKEVVEDPQIRAEIRARFGDSVFGEDGRLDRATLGTRVFDDPKELRDLENITHPAIRAELDRRLTTALEAGDSVVLDVPLLLEGGWLDRCDACVFVDADENTRRTRGLARGWPQGEVERRERSQTGLDAKLAASGYNVRNSGSLEQARRDVSKVIEDLRSTK